MSGWIKLEKNLRDDPRFLRMVRGYVTQVRCTERYAATLLSGCLAQLWMYADSHIREDDTLDLGPDEIDQLIGVDGFAGLMPADWFEVLNEHSVKLPGFQEHNGTEAKKKALTSKRVARHRIRNVTQERNSGEVGSNASALPDQTRPDQTRPDQERSLRSRNARDPDSIAPSEPGSRQEPSPPATEAARAVVTDSEPVAPNESASRPEPSPADSEAAWTAIRAEYPPGAYREAEWGRAEHHFRVRLDEGVPRETLLQAVRDYAAQQAALGNGGSRWILSPAKFFTAGNWRGPFPLPKSKAEAAQDANLEASRRWLEDASHATA